MDNTQQPVVRNELNVTIIHPERIIFDGKAKAVSSMNDRGAFDILPLHSNFVSLIKEKVIVYDLDNKKQEIPIEKAILKVYKNKVWIFIGISDDVNQQSIPVGPSS